MKIFKRVYYPVMAALVVLMLVLGMVDSRVATSGGKLKSSQVNSAYDYAAKIASIDSDDNENQSHNSYSSTNQQLVCEYILDTLIDAGAKRVYNEETDDDGKNLANYAQNEGVLMPTVYVQKTKVAQDSQLGGENEVAVGREIQNIILAVPGTSTDAILLHARYDSSALGGASDAAAVGSLLATAVNTLKFPGKNTVVFLFGDAGMEGDLGACAFINQFAGFDNVTGKIRAVADFKAGGTDGTLMMYSPNKGSLNLIGKYSRFNGSTFASSALSSLIKKSDYKSSGVFGDYNTLNFTNRGGFNRYATASDTKVNKKLVSQQANAMSKFVNCYKGAAIGKLDSKSSAVYFSYLDVMTVYYPVTVAFVIAGIILGLVIAIAVLNKRNKAFGWGRALAGAVVQLVTLLASSLAALALYYLFALLLSGFGVIPFHSLSAIKTASGGLFISASIMAVAIAIFFYIILKKTFAIKAVDVVRGNTLLFAAVAVILSFAAPALSYPFTCVALFSLVAMLMTVLFKNKFREKFSTDIERLFLYVWALVFSLPLFLPLMYAAQTLFPAVSIVLIMAVMILLAGFIAPFADYLKPVIDKAFKKLPMRTVRYERMVTEKVEDRAKKGKFTEVTSKKIVKEKKPWAYLNRIGLGVTAFVSAIMIVLFCSFGTTFSSAAATNYGYCDTIYDDTLLFVYEKNESSSPEVSVQVHDQIAYNYIRYAVNDLKWNADKNAYVKDYNGSVSNIINITPEISVSGSVVSFTTLDTDMSQITVTLRNASNIKSVIFNDNDEARKEEYTFSGQDEIVFRLPYGYSNFTMTVDANCDIEFEQHDFHDRNLLGIDGDDWDKLYDYYTSNKEVGPALRSGIVIKLTKSVSIS